MRHLIDILDLTPQEIDALIDKAEDITEHSEAYSKLCRGKKIATLFFEPSTRTRLSFEAAMLDLGGAALGFSLAASSSAAKGETVGDTVSVVGGYADIIAIRHHKDGAALSAALHSEVPVINAGDGGHHHPTQTLADLLTIKREKGRLHDLTIGICGDLKYGRTVHSLIAAMARYPNVSFVFISPSELRLPDYVSRNFLKPNGVSYEETTDLDGNISKLDILYMTRIQRERFASDEEYQRLKDCYRLTAEKLACAKEDMRVMHPLPRVREISQDVDADPRAAYFRQAKNGKFIRMALILKLLSEQSLETPWKNPAIGAVSIGKCENPGCITNAEPELAPLFFPCESGMRCLYCDTVK